MRALRPLLLSAAALALLAIPSAALAGAGQGVGYRLTGEPGSVLSGGFIHLPASAGETVSGRFMASNTTGKPVNVTFYGADGSTTLATGAVFGGTNPIDVGNWITPSRRSATLASGAEVPIDFTVRVPSNASVGDHVGAVIMEQQENASTATVKQVVRYAIPLLVDIAGGAGAQLELGVAKLDRIPGTDIATVVLPMYNSGSRICRPVVTANVAGRATQPMTLKRQLDEILPGDRINYPLRVADAMAPGTYLVRADVRGCGVTVNTSSSATLESSDGNGVPDPIDSGSGGKGNGSSNIIPVPLKRTDGVDGDGGGGGNGGNDGGKSGRTTSGQTTDPAGSGTSDDNAAGAIPAKPPSGPDGRSWLRKAGDAVAKNAPQTLKRASIPLGASALVGLLFFFQNALDRRDPKLAGAPRDRDTALRFDPNPLHS